MTNTPAAPITSAPSANPATKPHLFGLTPDELAEHCKAWGIPAFRGKQLMQWVYGKGIADLSLMTNLGPEAQRAFAENLVIRRGGIVAHEKASDGTQKLLLDWQSLRSGKKSVSTSLPLLNNPSTNQGACGTQTTSSGGGEQTECVMIPSNADRSEGKPRRTVCVSSQIGCPVGCKFCASGLGGLDGNLSAGQIIEQIWTMGQLPETGGRITNVVFMGMGEPLSNYNAVTQSIRLMTADWGLNLSARKVTVSTVGLPAQMKRLADLEIPITLAVSLHAPNDTIRREMIPWAEYVTIDQLVEAGTHYFKKSGREVTLEYTLMAGTNDTTENAAELARVAKRLRSNINLIRYNETPGMPYKRPDDRTVHHFRDELVARGINVHIRASRGRDISAACGQLRYEMRNK